MKKTLLLCMFFCSAFFWESFFVSAIHGSEVSNRLNQMQLLLQDLDGNLLTAETSISSLTMKLQNAESDLKELKDSYSQLLTSYESATNDLMQLQESFQSQSELLLKQETELKDAEKSSASYQNSLKKSEKLSKAKNYLIMFLTASTIVALIL